MWIHIKTGRMHLKRSVCVYLYSFLPGTQQILFDFFARFNICISFIIIILPASALIRSTVASNSSMAAVSTVIVAIVSICMAIRVALKAVWEKNEPNKTQKKKNNADAYLEKIMCVWTRVCCITTVCKKEYDIFIYIHCGDIFSSNGLTRSIASTCLSR